MYKRGADYYRECLKGAYDYLSSVPPHPRTDADAFIVFSAAIVPITHLFEPPLITGILMVAREFAHRIADRTIDSIWIGDIRYGMRNNHGVMATTAARVFDEFVASRITPEDCDLVIQRLARIATCIMPEPVLKFEGDGSTVRNVDTMEWQIFGALLETAAFISMYTRFAERARPVELAVDMQEVDKIVDDILTRCDEDNHPVHVTSQMLLAEVMPGTVCFVQHYLCTLPCVWPKRYGEILWNVSSNPAMFLMYNKENADVLLTGVWHMTNARRPYREVYRRAMAFAQARFADIDNLPRWPDVFTICSPAQINSHWYVQPNRYHICIYLFVHHTFVVNGRTVYSFPDPFSAIEFLYQQYVQLNMAVHEGQDE